MDYLITNYKIIHYFYILGQNLGFVFLARLILILLLFIFQLSFYCFSMLSDSGFLSEFLNVSGTNYDPVRDIYKHTMNEGGNSLDPGPTESTIENKKDTERLYDFLVQYRDKWIKDTGINLRLRDGENPMTEYSRIFAHIKKDRPDFFTVNETRNPGQTRLDFNFFNKLNSLKKNYPNGWPPR